MASFSFVQLASMASRCSTRSASSASSVSRRSRLAASVSLASATRSISSCRTRRSTTSISVGQRVDLDAQLGGRLVHQVDGLVRQEAAREVAVGQDGRRHQRGVLDAHAVVHLVALLQAPQDRDGVVDARLAHEHLLEAPLEGGVLLDVLAVLVEGGGADEAQLPTSEQRLQHVAGVHRPLGGAGADHGVELVDEGDHLTLGVGDLLQHGLQPLLELAAVLGARHHRTEIEADEPLVLQALGHVALDDPPGQALDDRRLADTRLTDQHRVVLACGGRAPG